MPVTSQVDEAFERRYAELEAFLAADEIEYTVIWPLQGLVGSSFPLRLDPGLELDVMSDRELEFALNAGAIWTVFTGDRLFAPGPEHRTCARHRYSLPKVTGDRDIDESHRVSQDVERRLQKLKAVLEESLALVLPEVVGIAARVTIATRPWALLSWVSLLELLPAARLVITRGARSALAATACGGSWPPDWDGLALGDLPADTVKTE